MAVYVYLLNMAELESPALLEQFLSKAPQLVDEVRRRKAEKIRSPRGQAISLGAGLLLQKAVVDFSGGNFGANDFGSIPTAALSDKQEAGRELDTPDIFHLSVRDFLEHPEEPIPLDYRHGEMGKPYLKNVPLYFNLSHSGDFVLCAVSRQEIGADIQLIGRSEVMRTAGRFFSDGELATLQACPGEAERTELFYRLWTKKEAYGKLTGRGIAEVISENMLCKTEVEWLTFDAPDGYAAAVCREKKVSISKSRV